MLCCGHQIIVVVLVGPPSEVSAIIFPKTSDQMRDFVLFCLFSSNFTADGPQLASNRLPILLTVLQRCHHSCGL